MAASSFFCSLNLLGVNLQPFLMDMRCPYKAAPGLPCVQGCHSPVLTALIKPITASSAPIPLGSLYLLPYDDWWGLLPYDMILTLVWMVINRLMLRVLVSSFNTSLFWEFWGCFYMAIIPQYNIMLTQGNFGDFLLTVIGWGFLYMVRPNFTIYTMAKHDHTIQLN